MEQGDAENSALPSDILVHGIGQKIDDLYTLNSFLRTCKEYYNAPQKGIPKDVAQKYSSITKEQWSNVKFGIDRLIVANPVLCKNLTFNAHLSALVRYARKKNKLLFEHVIKHENKDNRIARIKILVSFGYIAPDEQDIEMTDVMHLKNNMRAYRAVKKNDHYPDLGSFFSRVKINDICAVHIYLKNKINIHIPAMGNMITLHIAAAEGHTDIAQLLINYGADIDAQNDSGDTPLHMAASFHRENMVQLLLNNNANQWIENRNRDTPYDLTTVRQVTGTYHVLDECVIL